MNDLIFATAALVIVAWGVILMHDNDPHGDEYRITDDEENNKTTRR